MPAPLVQPEGSLIERRAVAVVSVEKAEFYREDYEPVCGIEITAKSQRIRLGSRLAEEEKDGLCAEIRKFLPPYAPELVAPKATG